MPEGVGFVQRFHAYLDDFIPFPGFPGISNPEPDVRLIPSFLNTVQKLNFDLALQMQGPGEAANALISLLGAKIAAGFYLPGSHCPDQRYFLPYLEAEPDLWRHLRLMEFLGISLRGADLEFPIFSKDWKGLQRIKEDFLLYQDYICIHPAAGASEIGWTPATFAQLAEGLSTLGYQVVLTGNPEDTHMTRAIALSLEARPIDLSEANLDPGVLAALISRACLVVSNDVRVSQLAAALRTPRLELHASQDVSRRQDLCQLLEDSMVSPSSDILINLLKQVGTMDGSGQAQ
ncbi:MAG TPA: glycosyltransferase family 9 protein [Anaerolineales bacterium]|nr:glycosyltransferase family 9 protein [Anaerolineales bacterium]